MNNIDYTSKEAQELPMKFKVFQMHIDMDYDYSMAQIHNDVKKVCKNWLCNFVYNDNYISFKSRLTGNEVKQGQEVIDNINYFNTVYRKPMPCFSCVNGEIV